MIRRWSYLNSFDLKIKDCFKFTEIKRLLAFRTSIVFKRFHFKITKFKRKTTARWKHSSTWLVYSIIFKNWSNDYKFNSKVTKFQFTSNFLNFNYFAYNFDYIRKRKLIFELLNDSVMFNVFPKKLYFFFLSKNNIFYFKNFNLLYLYQYENDVNSKKFIKLGVEHDNQFFSLNSNKTFFVDNFFYFITDLVVYKTLEIYKILNILFYFSLIKR